MERCKKCHGLTGDRKPVNLGDMVTLVELFPNLNKSVAHQFAHYSHARKYQPLRGKVIRIVNGLYSVQVARGVKHRKADQILHEGEPCSMYALHAELATLCKCGSAK